MILGKNIKNDRLFGSKTYFREKKNYLILYA